MLGGNCVEGRRTRVSYVKKALAKKSIPSLGLAVASLLLLGVSIYLGVQTQGQTQLNVGAMGFCSILLSLSAILYGAASFWDKDKNYRLAKLGIVMGGILLFTWLLIIVMGV